MAKNKHIIRRRIVFPAILLALVALGIGGTIAFNSNFVAFNNLFHLKYGETKSIDITPPDNWKRCDTAPKEVTTTNDSTFNIRVRLRYDEFWRDSADENYLPLTHDGEAVAVVNLQNEDDWEDGNDGWMYWKGTLAPGESTRSLLQSVTYNCDTDINTQTICTNTPTGTVCEQPEDPYNGGKFHVFVTVQTTEEEFPEDTYYNVSINPNGGTYNGSSEIFTDRVRAGTVIDLSNIERTDFEFHDWTLNDTDTFTKNMIHIDSDTNLVANWFSNIFHNVTVDPNGGTYDDKTETSTYEVREGNNYEILDATRDTYALEGWEYADETPVSGNTITNITDDVSIKAIWAPAVARIERTGKLYTSIMRAEAEAETNDIITLLIDTAETVINEKTVTLDLNSHTITGSLTNTAAGNITLINGEINNPDGIAVTNNGTLTMGVNDYKQDGTVNILNENIRLIGTTTGIKQNGVFNFYDGFLEGDVGLEGGYDDAPVYRNTYDDVTVHYFPLVDHIGDTSRQHVELASADLAVTKTTVNGDIYYYNIQDNVNTSARTGYKIYAVRDFNASYTVTIPADTTIDFDIVGYNITINDTLTNNGTLNIEDSHTTITRGDATIVYGGLISVPQTIINNGDFNMNNIKIVGNSENDTIQNYANLKMRGSILGATIGYVLHTISGATYDLDSNSYLYSTATGNYRGAVYNSISDFVWDTDGTIYGDYYGLENRGGVATIKKGTISGGRAVLGGNSSQTIVKAGGKIKSGYCGFETNGSASLVLDGGILEISRTTVGSMIGANDGSSVSVINGGKMLLTNTAEGAYEVYGIKSGYLSMDGGEITIDVKSTYYQTYIAWYTGANIKNSTLTFNDPLSQRGSGLVPRYSGNLNFENSTINMVAANECTGISSMPGTNTIKNSNITVKCDTNVSMGIQFQGGSNNTVTNSNITAESTSGTAYGIRIYTGYNATIIGGRVYGDTYGIFTASGDRTYATIGENEGGTPSTTSPEIIGGQYGLYGNTFYFYDGVLRGEKSLQEGVIKAMPEGYTRHTESSDDYAENTWLVPIENYLEVDGVEYNSLTAAYNAITGDSGTVKVIKNASIESALPGSPSDKEITFDLNGYELTYSQPLITNGTYIIQDSSNDKTGKLTNSNTSSQVITNNGNLTIDSGYISGARYGIYSNSGSSVVMNNGTIHGNTAGIYYYSASAITINSGLVEGGSYGIDSNAGGITTVKTGAKIKSDYCGFRSNGNSYVVLDGGIIEISRTTSGDMIGVQNNGVSIINGGKIILTNPTSASYKAYGVYNAWLSMDHGEINIDTNSTWEVEGGWYNGASIVDSTITINAPNTNSSALMYSRYDGNFIATNSTLSLVGNQNCNGVNGETRTNTITDSTITVTCVSGETYGFLSNGTPEVTITNSNISATTETGTAYGIRDYQGIVKVISGNIYGSTYGIWLYDGGNQNTYTVIGENEGGTPSTTSPEIVGGSYALYGGKHNFYDGILKGKVAAYNNEVVKQIADNSTFYIGTETIDGEEYEVRYLVPEYDVAQIGSTKYKKLSAAIAAAEENDEIELIADNYIFETINIPAEKKFTIDTKGYNIITGLPIKNYGNVILKNTSTGPTINYRSSDYFITNHADASLTLNNISINCAAGIDNKGSLSLTDSSIVTTSTAVSNSGTLTSNNTDLTGPDYAVYHSGTIANIDGGMLTGKYYNNTNTSTIANATIYKYGTNVLDAITNNATINLSNTNVTLVNNHCWVNYNTWYHARTILNNGTLTISNNSTIRHELLERVGDKPSAIYNNGSSATVTINDSHIVVDSTGSQYSNTNFGIYNDNGTVTMQSGSILVDAQTDGYGIYNATQPSIITLGVAEPIDSQDRGKETAHVSTTDPNIKAIGRSRDGGIGIKNANGSKTNFYDGIITGSTTAMPEEPAEVEYHYEAIEHTDSDGYNYRVLEFMRNQN